LMALTRTGKVLVSERLGHASPINQSQAGAFIWQLVGVLEM
jgi:hypothetical protein